MWTLHVPAIFDERVTSASPELRSAALLLRVGRLDEARPAIERVLRENPDSADAHALLAVIAVVENDKDQALALANKAVSLDRTAATLISLSYAHQARFEIAQARADARQATEVQPQYALAWARLAEMDMASGDLRPAVAARSEERRVGKECRL